MCNRLFIVPLSCKTYTCTSFSLTLSFRCCVVEPNNKCKCTICTSTLVKVRIHLIRQACHLKRHSAQHLDKKPHICNVCQRGFAFPSELRYHQAKHDAESLLSCGDCGQSFATAKALKQHQNTAHE